MNREFLEKQGLEKEQIDSIMAEYGKSIESYKTEVTELKEDLKVKDGSIDSYKNQVTEANKQIEEFKGMNIDEIKKTAEDYKKKAAAIEKERDETINKLKFNHRLETALKENKAKDINTVLPLLNIEELKLDGDTILGLDKQLKDLTESHDYLFESEEQPIPKITGKGRKVTGSITKEDLKDMSFFERVELKENNPTLYEELTK